jgi:hypothetical protein
MKHTTKTQNCIDKLINKPRTMNYVKQLIFIPLKPQALAAARVLAAYGPHTLVYKSV